MTPPPETAVHPVILRVPEDDYLPLALRDRVRFLSRYARRALAASAGLRGVTLAPDFLKKDSSGRPLPLRGGYWSISHKPRYVAGIFSPEPVGIDIERIRPYNVRLRAKVADMNEWRLVDPAVTESFFRFWTAKEAVLKIGGIGIADLLKCRVLQVTDRHRLKVRYQEKDYQVYHAYFDDHVVAVVEGTHPIRWTLPEPPMPESGDRR
jgi:4'-phosphopantetheinyl transferase